jgi:L-2-hydroxyglutarate oxidase LhgO
MSTASIETSAVVIGAGVVGLACAAALARSGRDVIVIERDVDVGRGITSRNSEVVHAGLYYEPGSLKAELCVRGRILLYERCDERGIGHRKLGKWIVATERGEEAVLEGILERGLANGVEGLERRSAAALRAVAPELRAVAALHSAETGIVDAHGLTRSLQAELEEHGGGIAFAQAVESIDWTGERHRVHTSPAAGADAGAAPETIAAEIVVNAAGIDADAIAVRAGLDVDELEDRHHLFKGDYFSLAPGVRWPIDALVYPVPSGAGLGVHATLDLAGGVRFGPDSEWVEEPRFDVDPAKARAFEEAVRRYWPGLPGGALTPAFAGLRPKRAREPGRFMDFVVREESARGRPGLIQCIGIESPGLTSALAIAERVLSLAG